MQIKFTKIYNLTIIIKKYHYTYNDLTRIILRPISALSLDEGLNSPCDKNASAAL
jgi:hypothetical protein